MTQNVNMTLSENIREGHRNAVETLQNDTPKFNPRHTCKNYNPTTKY